MHRPDPIHRLNAALDGRYRIERKLGEGGMATVYLADDVRHARRVALKVLKAELAAVVGAERFLAEIRTTANLQHPHILPLFDSGEADSFLFYVMPFVEGETLRDRLDREKQLPIEEAVRIATDVAEALQVAHDQGVIHRDIKPSNILLSNGRPLIADFGIALAVSTAGDGRLTETGLSMGTPYYMSPEQASADREPSAASDVYSLGCVLYEMLVGDPPHTASSAQAVLAKILTEDARAPTGSRASVPPHVDGAVRKALERVPADRFRSAADFARALATPGFRHARADREAPGAGPGAGRGRAPGAATLVVTLGLALVAAWGWLRPEVPPGIAPPVRVALADFAFSAQTDLRPVISRDGSLLVVHGPDEDAPFLMRPMDRTQFTEIAGTEGGREAALSPDGRWLAFRRGVQILRVELSGGAPLPVAEGFDPHWGADETIVFGDIDGRLHAVSPGGGDPTPLLAEGETARGSHPHLLPGGAAVVFQGRRREDGPGPRRLMLVDVASGSVTDLGIEGENPSYADSGHLLFTRTDGSLMAVPFDPGRLQVTGAPFTALTDVLGAGEEGDVAFSVSAGGTAVYLRGTSETRRLVERGLDGVEYPIRLDAGSYFHPRYSPDGRHIAYERDDALWIYDRETGASERFTEGPGHHPVWSPDGGYLFYSPSLQTIARERADGSGEPETIHAQDGFVFPLSTSPSGGELVLGEWLGPDRGMDLELLPTESEGALPRSFLRATHHELGGEISPDGAWMAYTSDESGEAGVYLRRFPDATGQVKVSGEGAAGWPVWAPDGGSLYYAETTDEAQGQVVNVPIASTAGEVTVGTPAPTPLRGMLESSRDFPARNWDLSPDGTRVVAIVDARAEGARTPPVRAEIVVNWFEELRRLAGR